MDLPDEIHSNQDAVSQAKQCVQDRPSTAIFGALAIGAFIGVLASRKLSQPDQTSRHLAAGLGEKALASLEKSLPDSIGNSLGLSR